MKNEVSPICRRAALLSIGMLGEITLAERFECLPRGILALFASDCKRIFAGSNYPTHRIGLLSRLRQGHRWVCAKADSGCLSRSWIAKSVIPRPNIGGDAERQALAPKIRDIDPTIRWRWRRSQIGVGQDFLHDGALCVPGLHPEGRQHRLGTHWGRKIVGWNGIEQDPTARNCL
jgi:hypothetical protein